MLTVKLVYKLSNVPDDLKWAINTRDTIYTHFQGITNNIYGFGRPFLLLHFFTRPPGDPYFYPSIFVFTRPNDWWTGLYIKLCTGLTECNIEMPPGLPRLLKQQIIIIVIIIGT